MLKPLLVLLTGKAGAGKSTVAEALVQSRSFTEVSLADKIKLHCSNIFDVPLEWFYDRDKKEVPQEKLFNYTPREILQWFGTDVFRDQISTQFWVKAVYPTIQGALESKIYNQVVVPDCRFIDEIGYFENKFGGKHNIVVIKVEKVKPIVKHENAFGLTHSSEKGIGKEYIDYSLNIEEGNIEKLKEKAVELIDTLVTHGD